MRRHSYALLLAALIGCSDVSGPEGGPIAVTITGPAVATGQRIASCPDHPNGMECVQCKVTIQAAVTGEPGSTGVWDIGRFRWTILEESPADSWEAEYSAEEVREYWRNTTLGAGQTYTTNVTSSVSGKEGFREEMRFQYLMADGTVGQAGHTWECR